MPAAEPAIYDPFRKHVLTTPTPNFSARLVSYDANVVHSILREGFVCHIGYFDKDPKVNRARVIPRQYCLDEDGPGLYLHGPDLPEKSGIEGHSSRLYQLVDKGHVKDVCVTVSLVDGLGVARSALHGTLNYRSVVIYGQARAVREKSEKESALKLFSDHVVAPGYAKYSRPAAGSDLDFVGIIHIQFEHVSAKIRTGEPSEDHDGKDPEDTWAGSLPVRQVYGPPKRASYIDTEIPVPEFVKDLVANGRGGLRLPVVPPDHVVAEERPEGAPLI